jgi:hypothetical protein
LSSTEDLEEVHRAFGEAQAQIIKGMLESFGIPCLLRSLAAPSVHPFAVDGLGEFRLMVPRSRAAEARELIRGTEDA